MAVGVRDFCMREDLMRIQRYGVGWYGACACVECYSMVTGTRGRHVRGKG